MNGELANKTVNYDTETKSYKSNSEVEKKVPAAKTTTSVKSLLQVDNF